MRRMVVRLVALLLGALAAALALAVARLRRMTFLPGHPGFWISHVVPPPPDLKIEDPTPLRLVVFGDSTTAGVGVQRADESLPYLLAGHLASARARPVRVISFGWSGARVGDLLRDQIPRASRPLRPGEAPWLSTADVVAVVVGANDATHRTPLGRFRGDLRRALALVRETAPAAEAVLAGVPRFRGALPQLEPLITAVDAYAVLLRRIQRDEAARANLAFADLARELPRLMALRGIGVDDALAADRFHPSATGYRVWADVIARELLADRQPAEDQR